MSILNGLDKVPWSKSLKRGGFDGVHIRGPDYTPDSGCDGVPGILGNKASASIPRQVANPFRDLLSTVGRLSKKTKPRPPTCRRIHFFPFSKGSLTLTKSALVVVAETDPHKNLGK